jgi:tRNA pseudouridine55 synthase
MLSSGLLLLHKQPGLTSFDSLRGVKRALGTGKVGHTGTLDKFAEGLLLILTGKALKLSRWFTHCDKQYEGTICFGSETDTLDPEGEVIANASLPSRDAVERAFSQFTGEILQAPPAYSAIHIEGERASILARQGKAPEMQKRPVTIYCLELRSWEPPFANVFVHCSSGTYIRSLARDIALAVGSRAHLSTLVRTKVAGFRLKEAVGIGNGENLGNGEWGVGSGEEGIGTRDRGSGNKEQRSESNEQKIREHIYLIDKVVFEKLSVPTIDVSSSDAQNIIQGKPLTQILSNTPPSDNTTMAVFSGDSFIAMIEFINNKWNYGYVYAGN